MGGGEVSTRVVTVAIVGGRVGEEAGSRGGVVKGRGVMEGWGPQGVYVAPPTGRSLPSPSLGGRSQL